MARINFPSETSPGTFGLADEAAPGEAAELCALAAAADDDAGLCALAAADDDAGLCALAAADDDAGLCALAAADDDAGLCALAAADGAELAG